MEIFAESTVVAMLAAQVTAAMTAMMTAVTTMKLWLASAMPRSIMDARSVGSIISVMDDTSMRTRSDATCFLLMLTRDNIVPMILLPIGNGV